ncbi:hypothetical protein M409DRAFT_15956 [Zasmidium cellare ATCC 36951]|uniref:Lysine-specific metallo-endopeptidase domain-containing protein n=1 Tax=Zasmidium cellare ATCC 36951 TaxID=1080233 RepID=A0A6A6D5P0_ZASCE|nr:uncharacterized protein M409DRAFT_15956 [Zasmidium cellare ATCC 36951]KAF2173680.1 hypothetical protein M409DRAFT_15956 [Zasmidium cellare ATCC 36951]
MERFFTFYLPKYFPYRNNNNGCKDHADALSNSYKEAANLIDAAAAAIASVKQNPRPNFFSRKDRWDWDRKAQAMLSMFGVKVSSKGGPLPESRSDFDFVEDAYLQQDEVWHGQRPPGRGGGGGGGYPGLYCGTDGWKFLKPEDDDPYSPGKKISDKLTFDKDTMQLPDGVWVFDFNYLILRGATSTDHTMCRDGVYAETLAPRSFITWCNLGFARLGLSIDPKAVKEFDRLDDTPRKSMSQTWVHELAHFYGSYPDGQGLPDRPAVDKDGNPALDKEGRPVKTYGIPLIFNLAKKDAVQGARTADAYGWFAVAMYLSDWNWSQGFAHKLSVF